MAKAKFASPSIRDIAYDVGRMKEELARIQYTLGELDRQLTFFSEGLTLEQYEAMIRSAYPDMAEEQVAVLVANERDERKARGLIEDEDEGEGES